MATKSPKKAKPELKPSQVLAADAQKIQEERMKLESELDKIRAKIGSLDTKLNKLLGDVVACL
jgi:hypothetical protein